MINTNHYIKITKLLLLVIMLFLLSCGTNDNRNTHRRGEALAKRRCSSCHLFPDPSLLDKKTWRDGVLPAMADQFGIELLQGNVYLPHKSSTLSIQDWKSIIEYYEALAPDSLIQPKHVAAINDWAIFSLKKPKADSSQISATILTRINSKEKKIYTSSLNNPALDQWDTQLKSKNLMELKTSAVDISFSSQPGAFENVITCMGGMQALDNTKGDIILTNQQKNGKYINRNIAENLVRPIESRPIDFNKDGLMDFVVCGFGHTVGGLYLLQQLPDKSFKKISIREVPGATQSIVVDYNKDGWPDIITLFAHADEGIWLFINNRKGGFIERNILKFPSVMGSSSFQLADVNKDGKPDIVYTAGDNSDYSRILKPYHGLYIFISKGDLQKGDLHFVKTYFYPLHGATKVIAKDFDMDGDIDFATIAFFADLKKAPSKTFVYLEQTGKKFPDFIPHAIPIAKSGRWICMDADDWDGDGDVDIVLGNYSKGFLNQENTIREWDLYTPFIVLENTVRNYTDSKALF